ncbi:hypothetical protein VPMG_00047 [Vibrio phage VBP32]|uniref:Uncharacterized protein n=2 Tax=Stoningtonvirus VBP47 TaxID=2846606 RepID=M4SP83_9CAUD|nr:hypothetical protein VPNG_00081 [Vibrio phage VBP47]YP_007676537.1 hypothetical protein VPMG_00047 [Vibrio phage VBP32]AGH57105.1 hypothetical protein VPNG_00081 [Vibrio phage VBP47]AGH57186.1 hypothetical protein VPMG_00047 [Vibrio phage VBP32]
MADIRYEVRESMPEKQALIIISTDHNGAQQALFCNEIFHRKESVESCISYWHDFSWTPRVRLSTAQLKVFQSREVLLLGTLEECVKYARTARMLY